MERTFCYLCGGKLSDPENRSWWCQACNQRYYDNPRPTADMVFFNSKGEVLLVKRGVDPGKGKWDIPGGFIEFDETLEEAVAREVEEELGIKPFQYSEPIYNTNYTVPYPWGKETYHIIDFSCMALIDDDVELKPDDDVADAAFYKLSELKLVDFSFPPQVKTIRLAAKKLGITT